MQLIKLTFRSLVIALPLLFIPNVFSPYEFPKFIFFAVVAELLAIFFALYWFSGKSKNTIFPKMDLGVFFVVGFGLTNLISDLLGINPVNSILGNNFRHQGLITLTSGMIIFFLLRSPLLFKKILPTFRKTALASAFLISLFAIWQVIQINIFHNYGIATYNGRIVGTLGNPNFLGGYLAMLLPFILWYPKKINKLFQLIIVSTIILTILFTDSRSAFLATATILLIYGIRWYLKLNLSKVITVGVFIIIAFLAIFKFIDLISHTNPVVFGNPTLIAEERGCRENWPQKYPWKFASDIFKNNSILLERAAVCDNRLLMWTVGLQTLIKRPILGFGQENFEAIIPDGTMYKTDNAHNIFLETAISSGIIGLLFYLSILFYALRKSSFDIKMSLIAFIIIGQFNPLSIAQIGLFWILLGFSQKENNSK